MAPAAHRAEALPVYIYRLKSAGEVYPCDPQTGAPGATPVARQEIWTSFLVRQPVVSPVTHVATFVVDRGFPEVRGAAPLYVDGVDPDGF